MTKKQTQHDKELRDEVLCLEKNLNPNTHDPFRSPFTPRQRTKRILAIIKREVVYKTLRR